MVLFWPTVNYTPRSTSYPIYEYIKAGANLLQLITGMIYYGPGTIKEINKGLVKLIKKDRYTNISEAVGKFS